MEIVVGTAPALLHRTENLWAVAAKGFASVFYSRNLDTFDDTYAWHWHTYEKDKRLIYNKCGFTLVMNAHDEPQKILFEGAYGIHQADDRLYYEVNGQKKYISGLLSKKKVFVHLMTADSEAAHNRLAKKQASRFFKKHFNTIQSENEVCLDDILNNTTAQKSLVHLLKAYGGHGGQAMIPANGSVSYNTDKKYLMDKLPDGPLPLKFKQ